LHTGIHIANPSQLATASIVYVTQRQCGQSGARRAKQHASLFVGQWAPTFLMLGLYNKMVKQLGHDRHSRAAA
jgi:hypothetical protein